MKWDGANEGGRVNSHINNGSNALIKRTYFIWNLYKNKFKLNRFHGRPESSKCFLLLFSFLFEVIYILLGRVCLC